MAKTFKMVDGDVFFDVNGRLDEIVDFQKVSQDLAEVLLTDLDVSRDFGSELNIVSSDPSFNVSEQQVSSFVMDAVDRLRNLQRTNPTTTRQEEISAVETIRVHQNDQTEILFGLSIRLTSGPSLESRVRLAPKAVSLEHLLPPSVVEQNQDIGKKAANANPVVTGEVAEAR